MITIYHLIVSVRELIEAVFVRAESLGDGLERVVGDEAHEETRRRIRSAAAGAHLAAGLRGLGLGLLGDNLTPHIACTCSVTFAYSHKDTI